MAGDEDVVELGAAGEDRDTLDEEISGEDRESEGSEQFDRTASKPPSLKECWECGSRNHLRNGCPRVRSTSSRSVDSFTLFQGISVLHGKGFPFNLTKNVEFWEKTLKADNFALGVVREGYRLSFISPPKTVILENNASAKENSHRLPPKRHLAE